MSFSLSFPATAQAYRKPQFAGQPPERGAPPASTAGGYVSSLRTLKELGKFYAPEMLDPKNLQGKKVLDVGSGHSTLAYELREQGIDAYSLDKEAFSEDTLVFNVRRAKLPEAERTGKVPESSDIDRGFLKKRVQADAAQLPFADATFDVLYSTYSLLTYKENPDLQLQALSEMLRVLKPGGQLRVSPVNPWHLQLMLETLGEDEKVKMTIGKDPIYTSNPPYTKLGQWVEIQKLRDR